MTSLYQLHVNRWKDCELCSLCEGRKRVVLSRGTVPADVLFIGEAPWVSEDTIGKPFCIKEDHRVLTADLLWKPLGDLKVGDKLLAPDEFGARDGTLSATGRDFRRWRVAEIVGLRRTKKPCKQLVTSEGELIITPDHRVLTAYKTRCKAHRWLEVDRLICQGAYRTSSLSLAVNTWRSIDSYKAGWMAGFLDGEGFVGGKGKGKIVCGFSQNSGKTCEQAKAYLSSLGCDWRVDATQGKCERIRINGGFTKTVKLLGSIRPVRLLESLNVSIQKRAPKCYSWPAVVKAIGWYRSSRPQNVVDIKTTTGTFVCEGFVVHNCGPAGKLLDRIISKAFLLEMPSIAFTNLVACKAKPPNEKQIQECSPRLQEFVDLCQPDLIVWAGKLAYKHKDQVDVDEGVKHVDIVHPAYILKMDISQRGLAEQRTVVTLSDALEEL